ncbi:hypothetical protein [Anabaena subtropica]|uniref:Phytanoyl-CoA dioxygenase n=1 Tax=Anabaena subtropica FACHB-260 TaxID=2692884 RepID=A0ABR8CLU4_9NOST|nr:hypothetical protein [Anabaena subtropica]MBD2343430.1 hypothetical protein [Anabaena subtropica FACHB-260]
MVLYVCFGKISNCKILLSTFFFTKKFLKNFQDNETLFNNLDVEKIVSTLEKEGLYLGINLPQDVAKTIFEFAMQENCYGNQALHLGFKYDDKEKAELNSGQKFTIGQYYNTANSCTIIKKLQADPKLLEIASKYLNVQAIYVGTRLWWSFAGDKELINQHNFGQSFHYDLDDYKHLCFFFYLVDVDIYTGPHICIRGSHKNKKLSYLFLFNSPKSIADQDIIDYYNFESLITICGKSGFGFAEDPFCIHKGMNPINKDRLILQIRFSINDYGILHDDVDISLLKNC